MRNFISRSLALITRAGVHDGLSIDQAKRIVMSNWIGFVVALNSFIMLWPFLLQNMPVLVWVTGLVMLLGVSIILLNAKRHSNVSRGIIVPFLTVLLVFVDYALIESDTARLWLYPISFLGFLVYGESEKGLALTASVIALLGMQWITYTTSHGPVGIYHTAASQLVVMNVLETSLTLITTIFLVVIFYRENIRAQRKIQAEKEKLSFIFDLVEEAVLITDNSGKIQPEYSKFTEKLFAGHSMEITNRKILDLLFEHSNVTKDRQDQSLQALESSLEGDELQWLGNRHLLVHELQVNTAQGLKDLRIKWQPIYQNDLIKGVLVTAQDISAERIEKKAQEKQQRLFEIVQAIFQHSRSRVDGFFQDCLAQLTTDRIAIPGNLKIQLHTLKGVARTLELKTIATMIHELEDALGQGHDLPDRLRMIEMSCRESLDLITGLVGESNAQRRSSQNLFVMLGELQGLALRHAADNELTIGSFAAEDRVSTWPDAIYDNIKGSLMHALTNSIDHGYHYPIKEGRITQKPICVQVKAWVDGTDLHVQYRDEGAGISQEQLRKLAQKAGPPAMQLSNPYDVLFLEGVSSAQTVTQTSGRGVGMTAIKHLIQELEGQVHIHPVESGGLQIDFQIPYATSKVTKTKLAA